MQPSNAIPWQRDDDAKNCPKCRKTFNVFRRKHHCRRCGLVVCDDCSPEKRRGITGYGDEACRVCLTCSANLDARARAFPPHPIHHQPPSPTASMPGTMAVFAPQPQLRQKSNSLCSSMASSSEDGACGTPPHLRALEFSANNMPPPMPSCPCPSIASPMPSMAVNIAVQLPNGTSVYLREVRANFTDTVQDVKRKVLGMVMGEGVALTEADLALCVESGKGSPACDDGLVPSPKDSNTFREWMYSPDVIKFGAQASTSMLPFDTRNVPLVMKPRPRTSSTATESGAGVLA
eukprot:PhM_4_TR8344/c0_g1_i1/m.17864